MQRGKKLLLNTVLLTCSALLMRTIALAFQVYLSNRIGSAGIGLFQLVMSVGTLAFTFAMSGIRFTTTRLVAEELGMQRPAGAIAAVRRCLAYSLIAGILASSLLYFGAEYLGTYWIGDTRTVLSLRILAISLPFLSAGAVLGGYFSAVQRVIQSAAGQIFEQLIKIIVVVLALTAIPTDNLEYACAAVIVGGVAGETLSFFLLYILYRIDRRRFVRKGQPGTHLTRRMFSIAVPLALSSYARTALSTIQQLLVPRGFRAYGASSEAALAAYGVIQGMVFPVITFPAAFFSSIAELLIPDLTEAQMAGNQRFISRYVGRILFFCCMFTIGVMGIIFRFARYLGATIYASSQAGFFIRAFAPLILIIYMDTVTDGMLKGLGAHIASMRYNILDALISVVLVYFLLPRYALAAYVCILYFTEIFNFTLSIIKLWRLTHFHLEWGGIFKSIFCVIAALSLSQLLLRTFGVPIAAAPLSLCLHILLSLVLYLLLLYLFGCIRRDDLHVFRRNVR